MIGVFLALSVLWFAVGWGAHTLITINYKRRWLEAVALLQGERDQIPQGPGAISAPPKPKDYGTRWKPVVAQESIYTVVYVTDGKRKVKVGDVWEESGTYESKLKSLMDKAKKRCNVLDEAM